MAEETRIGQGLYVDAIDVKPIDYDFGESYDPDSNGEAGRWSDVMPDLDEWEASALRNWLDEHGYDAPDVPDAEDGEDEDTDALAELVREKMQEDDSLAPMMNYAYPLPDLRMSAEQAQTRVIGTSCVVVNIGGEPFLALAGGGMDLSWEICRAYIALGYYPPAHFAGRLPNQGERDVTTAEIALESCRIAARWAEGRVAEAERILDHTREQAARA